MRSDDPRDDDDEDAFDDDAWDDDEDYDDGDDGDDDGLEYDGEDKADRPGVPRYRGHASYHEFADWVEPLSERLAGSVYALFEQRGRSFAAIEVSIEAEAEHVDGEVMFAMGPDIGFTVDLEWCEARFCELIGEDDEEWLDDVLEGLDEALEDNQGAARAAQRILDGVLAARRELVAREDG